MSAGSAAAQISGTPVVTSIVNARLDYPDDCCPADAARNTLAHVFNAPVGAVFAHAG
jgi:hypothetical protein